MKVFKISILVFWVISTTLFLIGVITPLSFFHKFYLYLSFFISFTGLFLLSYLLTDFITLKLNNLLIGIIGATLLILTYEFYPQVGSGWETQKVLYVHKDNSGDVIEFQKNNLGIYGHDYRTVKVVKVTPLYNWITILKKVQTNDEWIEVDDKVSDLKN